VVSYGQPMTHYVNVGHPRLNSMFARSILNILDPTVYNHLTHEKQLEIVKWNGCGIKHIDNQTEDLQVAAVKQNANAIWSIRTPCTKVLSIVLSNEELIITDPDSYIEMVLSLYDDNTVMVNKWLRYAENVRSMG
jgi:hypothetical protein